MAFFDIVARHHQAQSLKLLRQVVRNYLLEITEEGYDLESEYSSELGERKSREIASSPYSSGVNLTAKLNGARRRLVLSAIRPRVKRSFDFAGSLILVVVALPLLLLIVVLLVCSGQTPFYSHVRVGRGGRDFGCLKFRTMRDDADIVLAELLERDPEARIGWETYRKVRNDPRVTRIGRLLRITSLDELPQLLNILIGQMSLVGPRPVTRGELNEFYATNGAADCYCSVRPGLTGLWQVTGRSETGFATRVALDLQYIRHPSLRTDVAILFRTLDAVIRQNGAW